MMYTINRIVCFPFKLVFILFMLVFFSLCWATWPVIALFHYEQGLAVRRDMAVVIKSVVDWLRE
jgi:hypothetical protein